MALGRHREQVSIHTRLFSIFLRYISSLIELFNDQVNYLFIYTLSILRGISTKSSHLPYCSLHLNPFATCVTTTRSSGNACVAVFGQMRVVTATLKLISLFLFAL